MLCLEVVGGKRKENKVEQNWREILRKVRSFHIFFDFTKRKRNDFHTLFLYSYSLSTLKNEKKRKRSLNIKKDKGRKMERECKTERKGK